jgi:hypothetical protein
VFEADVIVPAIGQIIDPDLWDTVSGLERTRRNTIFVDPISYGTSIEGVFAGGDAGTGPATVVEAVAAGREAAESIFRHLNGEDMYEGRPLQFPENPQYPPIPPEIKREARAIAALRHPLVDIIVHPDNPAFPVDMEAVVEAAVREGKALEVNNSSFVHTRSGSEENCLRMARLLAAKKGLVAVGSDAHVATFAGEFSHAVEVLQETDIAAESVINYSIERLEGFLGSRGKPLRLE